MQVVTGGTGFVGTALVRRLLALGFDVRVISRHGPERRPSLFADATSGGRLEWFTGDIRDRASLAGAFLHARHVFHTAALVNSTAPYAEFERANVIATRNVCELAHAAGAGRLVHLGTCNVYGLPSPGETMTERTPCREWREPYADTKLRATRVIHEYVRRGMACATIHPGFVYGPGDRAFLPTLIRQLRLGFMPLWGPRHARVNLVYIDDLIDALLLAAESDAARNEEFLVLDEGEVGLDEVCAAIARQLGIPYRPVRLPYPLMMGLAKLTMRLAASGVIPRPMLSTTDVKSFGHDFRLSTAKARTMLGWAPATPFETGISRAIASAAGVPATP